MGQSPYGWASCTILNTNNGQQPSVSNGLNWTVPGDKCVAQIPGIGELSTLGCGGTINAASQGNGKKGSRSGGSGSPAGGGAPGVPNPAGELAKKLLQQASEDGTLATLQTALKNAEARSAAEVRDSLTPDQIQAGRLEGMYLQRIFYGSSIENAVADDPSVQDDPNITHLGTSRPGQALADFEITVGEDKVVVDITGPSLTSKNNHLARPYINAPSQILTYDAPSAAFLAQVFR